MTKPETAAEPPYTFTLSRSGKITQARCVHSGVEYGAVGADAERDLARTLVRTGFPDGGVVSGGMHALLAVKPAGRPDGYLCWSNALDRSLSQLGLDPAD